MNFVSRPEICPRQSPVASRGFTLIELIVVVSILSLLVVLTLGGVQAARESARRASCSNNLRQIGIGIHSYASSVGCFPMGNSGKAFSAHAAILPYRGHASERTKLYAKGWGLPRRWVNEADAGVVLWVRRRVSKHSRRSG